MAIRGQTREKDIPATGMNKKRTITTNPDPLPVAEFRAALAKRNLKPDIFVRFQKIILSYYDHVGRDLAWRHTTDPYHILVSEIMLQQTQVGRVATKYPEFIGAFPTFSALADAPLHQVLEVWQGMGYNRRAIALQACAKRVETEFSGTLPDNIETLNTFPGIGHATACSIAAFAFNIPVVFIETNIRRVFIHFFFGDQNSVHDREILPLVRQALDTRDPRAWYFALMDYGSALKQSIPNPNKKSAHYTKQSKFEGSDREIRGMVLKSLLLDPLQDEKKLVISIPRSPSRVHRIIGALVAEEFIIRKGKALMIRDR